MNHKMKKIIISLSLCLCVGFAAMAQDEEVADPAFTNKRGIELLPKAGDFALGIDAYPFLQYLGNFFSRSGNSAPDFQGFNETIYGKYFLADDRAIRAKLKLDFQNTIENGVVRNDEEVINNPLNANATVIDVSKYCGTDVVLSVGYELRRGKGRVQGFYGGEVVLGYGGGKQNYEYANPMTAVNQTPTSYWGYSGSSRMTERKYGKTFSAGLGGFVGVEYFFAPQISIGGELALSFNLNLRGQTETTQESWNTSNDRIQVQTVRSGDWYAQRALFRTNTTGGIFLMFHF